MQMGKKGVLPGVLHFLILRIMGRRLDTWGQWDWDIRNWTTLGIWAPEAGTGNWDLESGGFCARYRNQIAVLSELWEVTKVAGVFTLTLIIPMLPRPTPMP